MHLAYTYIKIQQKKELWK